jgi:SAM-dependent methyltransferase
LSSRQCLVCGGTLAGSALPGLLVCGVCSFTTADLTVSDAELSRLYGPEYFAGQEYMNYVAERPLIGRHFKTRLNRLLRYVADPRSKRLFEIGSAHGFFLEIAREYFQSVEGIDISVAAATYARVQLHLPVTAGEFLTHEMSGPVDVVCLWDTIEHLRDPHLYIEKAASYLRPGGAIALTTGDIGSWMARWRGARWRQIHPPTHLHYFSKSTLTRLLERHGFTVAYAGYDGMYRSVDTMAYILLNIKRSRPRIYGALKNAGLLNWNLYLNLYDIVYMIATKK